jgi:hypothetical protein
VFTNQKSGFIPQLFTVLLAGSFVLSACSPAVSSPTATSAPMATVEPTTTTAAVSTQVGSDKLALDTGGMATNFQTETVPAVSAVESAPIWEVLPEYTRVTLQGYPISSHLMKPQIFIYPVKELGEVNEGAGKIAAALQTLLQTPQEAPNMPFLPLVNTTQVMHAQVQYLDFKNGKGVRYLTEFAQGMMPVNNYELIYTYQGLTGDRKYYVAAVLPVNHPSLPADGKVTGNEPPEFTSDFRTYLANVVKTLNPQTANTFTPDLTRLDAMMSSLEIR